MLRLRAFDHFEATGGEDAESRNLANEGFQLATPNEPNDDDRIGITRFHSSSLTVIVID